jgi:hypothetical protein
MRRKKNEEDSRTIKQASKRLDIIAANAYTRRRKH